MNVKPLRSLVAWFGGKRQLAPLICARIEAIPHDLYVEAFIGMGSIFLARRRRVRVEVINDRNRDVVNLFRIVRHHPAALVDELRLSLVARAEFERLIATPPETLTDIQRAARFFALQRLTYGGKPVGLSLPARTGAAKSLWTPRLLPTVLALRERLGSVMIEEMDWSELLRRYDRPGGLVYADPPYHGRERSYGRGLFDITDHARLAEALLGLRARFVLSINDTPEIRSLYQGRADIEEVSAPYSVSRREHVRELLIQGGGRG